MMRQLPLLALTAALTAAFPLTSSAQISTDRPDFVEASTTVPRGALQIETSVAFSDEGDALDTWTTPTLFRLGIAEGWEARVESAWLLRLDPASGDAENGLADIAVGLKWHAHEGEPGTLDPSIGFLVHADLPTHSDGQFGSNGIRPSLRLVGEWELPSDLALGVMPGVIYERGDGGDRYTAGIFGAVLAKSWTDRFRTFVESAWEQIASDADGGNVGFWDVGATWLLQPTLQLDAAASFGATDESPDFGLTVGLSAIVGG